MPCLVVENLMAHPQLSIFFFFWEKPFRDVTLAKIVQVWSAHCTVFRDVTVDVTVEKKSFAHPLYFFSKLNWVIHSSITHRRHSTGGHRLYNTDHFHLDELIMQTTYQLDVVAVRLLHIVGAQWCYILLQTPTQW